MKQFYTLILLLITATTFAQIPSNYWDSANGLTGFTLKTELRDIITANYDEQTYGALLTGYISTHSDVPTSSGAQYDNDGTVLLYYTEKPTLIDSYSYTHGSMNCGSYDSEADCYNREHLVPQSTFGSALPMQSDIHHVIPSDGYVNGQRGNLPFGIVGSANYTSDNGSKRGTSAVPGYSGDVFEPIDEFKGDIARALLYFAVRYQNNVDTYSWDMFNGTENQVFETWALDMLLDWHNNVDPVDQRERDRNNAAYTFQNNANPFVDHPEYANLIWNPNPDTEAPSDPTNLVASNPTDNSVDLTWDASTDNIAVTSYDIYVDGSNDFNSPNTSFTVPGLLADMNYCFTVKARDAAGNESNFSNQDCETTTDNGSGSLCASETFENIPANSGSYDLRQWTGDNGLMWTATDARTDQTLNNRAITIRNGELTAPTTAGGIGNLTVTTQLVFSGSSGTFDVKVNGVVVGTIPYDATEQTTILNNINIENNVDVVFESNSTGSNRVRFDDLSWTCYSALSIDDFELESVKIYPNPVDSMLYLELNSELNTSIEIYNILGKKVFSTTIIGDSEINLDALSTGMYIVKLTQGNASVTKKLIKN